MKLHLPKTLLVAVLAACVAPTAWGTTYTVEAGSDDFLHSCYFTNETNNTKDTTGDRWKEPASDGDGRPGQHTLRFTANSYTGENTDWKPKVDYSNFAVAGIIVEEDSTVKGIENNNQRKFYLGATGVASSSTISSDFTFSPSNGMEFRGVQSWSVADGVTLKFEESNVTNNAAITLSGSGNVDFSSKSVSGSGAIIVENGTIKNATFASGAALVLSDAAKLDSVTLSDGAYVGATYTYDWGESGVKSISKTLDLSTSSNVTVGNIQGKIYVNDVKVGGTATYDATAGTIALSAEVYHVATSDTVACGTITQGEINVDGTLSSVTDSTLGASQGTASTKHIVGAGAVQVNAMLEYGLSALADFTGTVEVVSGGKIHFGNANTSLSNIDKIKIDSGAYITGHTKQFNHDVELNGGEMMVNNGSWAGDIHVSTDSSIGVYNDSTIKGKLSIEDGKTLSITKPIIANNAAAAPTLTLSGTVGKLDGGTLDIQHGTVKIDGHSGGNALIAGAIKVGAGAKLQVASHDTLGYSTSSGNYTDSITAQGSSEDKLAKIQFDDTQTMSTNLELKGYTEMSGSAFNSFGGNVTVSGSNNTIKNTFNLRDNVTYDVSGSLTMEGAWTDHAELSGKFVKDGAGEMTINGLITSGRTFQVDKGTLNIGGGLATADSEATANTINKLDLSQGTTAGTSVKVKEGASLTIAGELLVNSNSSVNLENKASLTNGVAKITGISGTTNASITYASGGENQQNTSSTYSVGSDAHQINNARVEIASESAQTVSNRLVGVELVNKGEGTITAGNGYNSYTALVAESGNLFLKGYGHNAGSVNQGELLNLAIGAQKNITAYTKWNDGDLTQANEATLVVNGSASFGKGATLVANLELMNGTSLTLDGALAMGSTLTLGTALTLDDATRQAIMGLSAGEKHALFTGVDALTLNGATYTIGTVLDSTTGPDLGTYFVLADAGTPAVLSDTTAASGYYLGYTAEGTVYAGKVIPEPTTATLSLLALAALAARRRRK